MNYSGVGGKSLKREAERGRDAEPAFRRNNSKINEALSSPPLA